MPRPGWRTPPAPQRSLDVDGGSPHADDERAYPNAAFDRDVRQLAESFDVSEAGRLDPVSV